VALVASLGLLHPQILSLEAVPFKGGRSKDCGEWTVVDVNGDDKSRRIWHRAARLYERAADFYRRAGLGIMGMVAWQKAAACYAALGMHEDTSRCTRKADTIRVFWNDDEAPYSENQGGQS
jgi:hypothetical protein